MSNVLIFRCGSIGDFVVTLPCLHLIRNQFPRDRLILLSDTNPNSLAAPAASIVGNSGLVDEVRYYPGALRKPSEVLRLRETVRSIAPRTVVYLMPRKGLLPVVRDFLFFKWCGVGRIVGLPLSRRVRASLPPPAGGRLWEPEAGRLGRQIASLGQIDFGDAENWNLNLTEAEIGEAESALSGLPSYRNGRGDFIAISVGTKQPVKDWGDDNWRELLRQIAFVGMPLVFIGARDDTERSERMAAHWPHGHLNLCGKTSPRVSAAVLRRARLFIGHDSGPMHLAAAVGTQCVAVFSKAKNKPGEWFPFGTGHKVHYPWTGDSIMSIRPADVAATVKECFEGAPRTGNSVR